MGSRAQAHLPCSQSIYGMKKQEEARGRKVSVCWLCDHEGTSWLSMGHAQEAVNSVGVFQHTGDLNWLKVIWVCDVMDLGYTNAASRFLSSNT